MVACKVISMALLTILSMPLQLYNYETKQYKDMSANPIILDVDFCGDVDDAVAVRMATRLDSMHVCTLKAVGLSVTSPDNDNSEAKALHGLLSYDGYGHIPIGADAIGYKENKSKYWDVLKEYSTQDPTIKKADTLYKEILSNSYNKVTIITTGYLTNIEALLNDEEGYSLVKNRCKKIVVMGGDLDNGWDNNFAFHKKAITATKNVINKCPVEIVFVTQEIADNIKAGQGTQQKDKNDPLSRAISAWGSEDGRTAWDPFAVLIGCLPEKSLNLDYKYVKLSIDTEGVCKYEYPEEKTKFRIVTRKNTVTDAQYQALLEGILTPQ